MAESQFSVVYVLLVFIGLQVNICLQSNISIRILFSKFKLSFKKIMAKSRNELLKLNWIEEVSIKLDSSSLVGFRPSGHKRPVTPLTLNVLSILKLMQKAFVFTF